MEIDIEAPLRQSKKKWADRWLKRRGQKSYLECGKSTTTCKCPKCGNLHQAFIQWTGHGTPRIFCQDCKVLIAAIDDLNNHGSGGAYAKGSRKKTENYFE